MSAAEGLDVGALLRRYHAVHLPPCTAANPTMDCICGLNILLAAPAEGLREALDRIARSRKSINGLCVMCGAMDSQHHRPGCVHAIAIAALAEWDKAGIYLDPPSIAALRAYVAQPTAPAEGLDYDRMVEAGFLDAYLNIRGVEDEALAARMLRSDMARYAAPAEGLDVERLIESIAYMGVIDIHQQVCAWCGMRYGYPHRDYCPITAQEAALRAALTPEDDR